MDDSISRAAAIDDIKAMYEWHDVVTEDRLIEHMKRLPAAQPERKTGRWIDETFKPWGLVYHPYKCNQCGEHSETDSNFCPHCGADMRGGQND